MPPVLNLSRVALLASAGALLITAYLNFAWVQQVDPLLDPVSDYVFHNGLLFVASVLSLMAGGFAVTTGMKRAGIDYPKVAFGLWFAGLALVAIFPGNPSVDVSTVAGEIHRFGGAMFLASLPVACWLLARTMAADPVWTVAAGPIRAVAVVGALTAASFGASQFVVWLPLGLLERFALAAEIALVVVLALTIRRAAR
ncbi:DUF998 domain-containing protein [Kibdelosporangium persicum]|uniref:DUF998 domain-containing protein n=1 Tax=Kibdelosporangium persicum TaxID=2698649 RepID=A0ABX2F571_9PSEU|nr:DUF998 domain-containing protein [Kibdelosporangium persicum]NRN65955.1 hypothetical protein [Kibdelosporangium persicum]